MAVLLLYFTTYLLSSHVFLIVGETFLNAFFACIMPWEQNVPTVKKRS